MDDNDFLDHLDSGWKRRLRRALLCWFDRHARDLPWRRTRDPYRIWVSEIMLQQTQVATVIPYYNRFIEAFPDVASLAAAEENDVLRLWEGLGYYRRARQLHAAAKVIADRRQGQFPRDFESVLALPGIGRYTAGAILSISADAPHPILEANTIRLYSRLMAYDGDPHQAAGQQLLWRFADEILPRKRAGAFNQALMELGGEICAPREPQCDICPVAVLCRARANNQQHTIPRPKKKTLYEDLHEAAVVVRRRDHVLLRRCLPQERWAGLWDFPRFPVKARQGAALARELEHKVAQMTGIDVEAGPRLAIIKHGVTRYRITLLCHEACSRGGRLRRGVEAEWIRPGNLENYALSVTGRKLSKLLA